ncbi:hypothetical protein FACS1894187_23030 [Synergistales bacterium]|nr:hypothetical protein FACS1894187_23030 [Synergistales bacterium]
MSAASVMVLVVKYSRGEVGNVPFTISANPSNCSAVDMVKVESVVLYQLVSAAACAGGAKAAWHSVNIKKTKLK